MSVEQDSSAKVLTGREWQVATHLVDGLTAKESAKILGNHPTAIARERSVIYRKVGARNKAQAIGILVRQSVVEIGVDEALELGRQVASKPGVLNPNEALPTDSPEYQQYQAAAQAMWDKARNSQDVRERTGAVAFIANDLYMTLYRLAHDPILDRPRADFDPANPETFYSMGYAVLKAAIGQYDSGENSQPPSLKHLAGEYEQRYHEMSAE